MRNSALTLVALAVWTFGADLAVAKEPVAKPTMAQFEAVLHQQFPRSRVGLFNCGDDREGDGQSCLNLVSYPKPGGGSFGVNYMVKTTQAGDIKLVTCISASPAMVDPGEAEYMTAVYVASAIAIVTVTAPRLQAGSRIGFIKRTMDAEDDGVKRDGWLFTAGNSMMASFSAEKR